MITMEPPSTNHTSISMFLNSRTDTLTEFIDNSAESQKDLKQDALVRLLTRLRSLGETVPDDPLDLVDRYPDIANNAYKWARVDSLRRSLGRGKQRRPVMGSIDFAGEVWSSLEEPFAAAEARTCLSDLWSHGTEEVSPALVRDAILLLSTIQQLRDSGEKRVPDRLRQQLHRLRGKTNLPLNTSLL
jgi:hypothetical protein